MLLPLVAVVPSSKFSDWLLRQLSAIPAR